LRAPALAVHRGGAAGMSARNRGERFSLLRTRALLLLALVSLKRGKELGQTLSSSVLRLPGDKGLLFNYVWGKTLRSGARHVFGVLRKTDRLLCPVLALDQYVSGAKRLGVALAGHGKYLFPPWRAASADGREPAGAANVPLASAQINTDLQKWLRLCGIFAGETLHGIRSGGSIELSLTGKKLASVMQQADWASKGMASHYMKIWEVMCASVAGESPQAELSARDYEAMNDMIGFCKAFS